MKNNARVRMTATGWELFNPTTHHWIPCSRYDAHIIVRNVLGFRAN